MGVMRYGPCVVPSIRRAGRHRPGSDLRRPSPWAWCWAVALGFVLPQAAAEQIPAASAACVDGVPETTPSIDFTIVDDGSVVRHERTGLEWRRCAEGMEWNGEGCGGFRKTMTWRDALQAAAEAEGGWRLPDINELRSLAEECRADPAINTEVFPDAPATIFWSASPALGSSSLFEAGQGVWRINFTNGADGRTGKDSTWAVRFVRTSE